MEINLSEGLKTFLTWVASTLITAIGLYIVYVRDVKIPRKASQFLDKIQQAQKKINEASKLLSEFRKLAVIGIDIYLSITNDPELASFPSTSFAKAFPNEYKEFVENTKNIKFGILSKGVQKTYDSLLDKLEGLDVIRTTNLKDDLIREIRQSQNLIAVAGSETGLFSDLFKNLVKIFV